MPLVFTRLGISCFTMIDIILMLFLFFLCFQKLNGRMGALQTVDWSPARKARKATKVGAVLTSDNMSEEESDPKHPQQKCTVILLPWESRKLRLLKFHLDEHQTAVSMGKGKGVCQPVERDQADWLSDFPKPANAPAWACS